MSTERQIIEDLVDVEEHEANQLNVDEEVDPTSKTNCSETFVVQGEKIYSCDLCNVHVNGSKVLKKHLEGKKHRARANRQGKTFDCELCGINCNSQSQLDSHLRSSRHKTRKWKKDHPEIYLISCIWIVAFLVLYLLVTFLLKIFFDN